MSDDEFGIWQKRVVVALVVALGGNAGLMVLNKSTPIVRNDPFTGTQGIILERRIDKVETDIRVINYRLQVKHDAIEKLKECCEESRANDR